MIASRSEVWLSRGVLITVAVLNLMPLIYLIGISFRAPQLVFVNPLFPLTVPLSFENYRAVLSQMDILRYLLNSIAFSGSVTVGQLLLAIPAAFSFTYFSFRFKNILLGLVILSLVVPFVVTYIPNYLLLAKWRLINTILGLVLPMLGISLGFGIFLLRQHFMGFPREIIEAAMIDGANSWDILWRVVLPANLSPVVAVGIYVMINTWNQFIWPLLVGGGHPRSYTLTVAVQIFYTSPEGSDYWGAIMAASVLASLPTVIVFLLMRRKVLESFVEGALRG